MPPGMPGMCRCRARRGAQRCRNRAGCSPAPLPTCLLLCRLRWVLGCCPGAVSHKVGSPDLLRAAWLAWQLPRCGLVCRGGEDSLPSPLPSSDVGGFVSRGAAWVPSRSQDLSCILSLERRGPILALQTRCTRNHNAPQKSPATPLALLHREVETGAGALG